MVKSIISNPIGKSLVAAAMLTSAVIGTNATNLNTNNNKQKANSELISKNAANASTIKDGKNKTSQPPQTELVGIDAAKAAMTNAIRIETFSFEHNKKLDKTYLENCENDLSKRDKKSNLDAIYRVYGTYGATIEIQRAIDSQFMENTINSFLNHYALTDKERSTAQEITAHFYGWQDQVLFTDLFREELKMYDEQEFPSAETAISYIDKHINNTNFFTETDKKIYEEHSRIFQSKQINKTNSQALSDLLAYKVHLLNVLAFNNYFTKEYAIPEKHLFNAYFHNDFINGQAAIKP